MPRWPTSKVGDRVEVLIVADEGTTDADAQTQPAFSVSAYVLKNASAYSFAGKVTELGDGTITVKLRYASPSARARIGTVKGTTLTFATSDSTRFQIRNQSGSFSDVAVGDLVAIGIGGSAGASKEEILATPADALVLDLKKKSSSTSTATTQSLAVARR